MNSKNILFFLLALIIYLNFFMPLAKENRELKNKIIATDKSIKKDKLYIQNQKRINLEINQSKITNQEYDAYYFYQQSENEIFNLLQKEIKNLVSTHNINEDHIKWGESYVDEHLMLFPISVRVSGGVSNIGRFFSSISSNPKVKIKDFTMRKTKEHYILKITLYGLKRVR